MAKMVKRGKKTKKKRASKRVSLLDDAPVPRADYAAIATKKIIDFLRLKKKISRTEIQKLLKGRDRRAMDDVLTFLIQNRHVALHQERTSDGSRAMYSWLGGVDGEKADVTDGEVELMVQELAARRLREIQRAAKWRRQALEEDRQRRMKEWDEAEERVREKKAGLEKGEEKSVENREGQSVAKVFEKDRAKGSGEFVPPTYAPMPPEARDAIEQMHEAYERAVREHEV